jgi:hypothetical protein
MSDSATREPAGGFRSAILVEGSSDREALTALATRRGLDLGAEGVGIVAMGGATNLRVYLQALGPRGERLRLAGLCDAGEEGHFRRGLQESGMGVVRTRGEMEQIGFFVCEADLEDELIRALGPVGVGEVIEAAGESGSFRRLQAQPAQRESTIEAQLRRFMGSKSGRKTLYARLLVEALDLDRVPRPLDRVLAHL